MDPGSPTTSAAALFIGEPTHPRLNTSCEDCDFLLRTWDPRTRPDSLTFDNAITWTHLEIVKSVKGQQSDYMGMVHFRAHYLTPQGPGVQEERSRFVRQEGGSPWIYVD